MSTEAIAHQEDLLNWQHLRHVQLPRTIRNGQVNLLIGVDVPKALEPHEIRRCHVGNGPFAIRTAFGWTLNGTLGRPGNDDKTCFSSNLKSVDDDRQTLLMKYINQEFNEPLSLNVNQ